MEQKEWIDSLKESKGISKAWIDPFMDKEFDIYVTTDREENKINDVVRYKLLNGIEDMSDGDFNSIVITFIKVADKGKSELFDIYISSSDEEDLEFNMDVYPGNKFANRRSYNEFVKVLRSLYMRQDPNVVSKALGKINDTNVSEITWKEDKEKNGQTFWNLLNRFGYDWDKFKNKFLTREIWGDY